MITVEETVNVLPPARTTWGQSNAGVISPVAWHGSNSLELGEWLLQGKRLGAIGRGVSWWIGDWVNWGNQAFGEKYVRAAHVTGYDVQTLTNMAYVASRFHPSRRRENLSWSHHAEVAGLTLEEREKWLDHAEAGQISVHRMREELRTWRALAKRTGSDGEMVNDSDHDVDRGTDHDNDGRGHVVDQIGEAITHRMDAVRTDDDPGLCPRCGCPLHGASTD